MARAMQVPLQIAFHHLRGSEAVKGLIEEKVAWLERFHGRITGCRVRLEAPHRGRRQGGRYRVRIDLAVPQGEVVVNRQPPRRAGHEDLDSAIQHAFDAARRQLEEHARRLRRDPRPGPG